MEQPTHELVKQFRSLIKNRLTIRCWRWRKIIPVQNLEQFQSCPETHRYFRPVEWGFRRQWSVQHLWFSTFWCMMRVFVGFRVICVSSEEKQQRENWVAGKRPIKMCGPRFLQRKCTTGIFSRKDPDTITTNTVTCKQNPLSNHRWWLALNVKKPDPCAITTSLFDLVATIDPTKLTWINLWNII